MSKLPVRVLGLIVVFALVFGGSPTFQVSAASSTYYISPTGSDANPGSFSAPFKTFTKAVSVLQAGDTLQVMAGYYIETLDLSRSGTAGAPITVIGNGAVLNMKGVRANGINIKGDHIRVSGFEVVGATDFGILVSGKYITVENNIVHDNVTKNGVGVCGLSASWGSAIKVKVGGENTVIRNNTVYDNCGEGIAVTRGVTALVEGNNVSDSYSVNIYIDNSMFVTVKNNTSYCTGTHLRDGNRAKGVALGEEFYTGWGAQLHDITISGNTITDCIIGIAAYESNVGGTLTNVAILNNTIPSGQKRSISLLTLSNQNVRVSNNLIFNSIYVVQPAGITLGTNTISNVASPSCTGDDCPTFADVPSSHWAWQDIERLYNSGITAGCGTNPLIYCPDSTLTRAQMAVFLLRGIHGASYSPPPVGSSTGFEDVPVTYWAAAWIKQLTAEGITSGCSYNPPLYCPEGIATQAQIAVFLLRSKYGRGYTPPTVGNSTGFNDVPTNYWAAAWIKQLKVEGITTGCGGGNFCPESYITRAQMAGLFVRTFNLP